MDWDETPELPCVYFLAAGRDGPIKIGWTAGSVMDRMAQLQVGCPFELILLGTLYTEAAPDLERQLHQECSEFHCRGEWFLPHPDLYRQVAGYLGKRRL